MIYINKIACFTIVPPSQLSYISVGQHHKLSQMHGFL